MSVRDVVPFSAGSYVLDRRYVDWSRLYRTYIAGAFFVVRAERGMRFYVAASRSVNRQTGLRFDQTIRLNSHDEKRDFPAALRRIGYVDPDTEKRLILLSSNFATDAYNHRNLSP